MEEIKKVEETKETKTRLVNARPIKEYIKEQGLLTGGTVADELTVKVQDLLREACVRAAANGRKTVQPQDL